MFELDEEITVNFTIPSASSRLVQFPSEAGPGGATIDSVVGTIINDDTMPSVTIADAEGLEGDTADNNKVTFTITLSEPAGVPVTVNYVTADVSGGATAGIDYSAVASAENATATITESTNTTTNTTGTFEIDITGDTDTEADETFEVTISAPVNATLGGSTTATGTILSDDAIALSIESIEVDENVGTASVRVSLANPGASAYYCSIYYYRWYCSCRFRVHCINRN